MRQVVSYIQEPKALKERVKQLYHKYCADMISGACRLLPHCMHCCTAGTALPSTTVGLIARPLFPPLQTPLPAAAVCVYVCVCV